MTRIAFAPVHFQIGSKARASLERGQSGNKKSALSRVSFPYGPEFTAIRAD